MVENVGARFYVFVFLDWEGCVSLYGLVFMCVCVNRIFKDATTTKTTTATIYII